MGSFFAELKRRHIYRVAAAYAVVAWVLLQLFNNLMPIMKLPMGGHARAGSACGRFSFWRDFCLGCSI